VLLQKGDLECHKKYYGKMTGIKSLLQVYLVMIISIPVRKPLQILVLHQLNMPLLILSVSKIFLLIQVLFKKSLNPNMKLAVIVNKMVMTGLVSMYKTYFELNNNEYTWDMKMFENENDAREWVNAFL